MFLLLRRLGQSFDVSVDNLIDPPVTIRLLPLELNPNHFRIVEPDIARVGVTDDFAGIPLLGDVETEPVPTEGHPFIEFQALQGCDLSRSSLKFNTL